MSDDIFQEGDDSLVDWDNVADVVSTPLPDGEYNAIITSAEYKLSQSSGMPMWALELTIQGSDFDGRKIFENISFSDKAKPYTKKKLAQLDPKILSIVPFDLKKIPETLVGKNVRIRTRSKEEEYQGEKQLRSSVMKYLPTSGADAFLD